MFLGVYPRVILKKYLQVFFWLGTGSKQACCVDSFVARSIGKNVTLPCYCREILGI